MKRFHLFAFGQDGDGGMNDYQGSFETLNEAQDFLKDEYWYAQHIAVTQDDGSLLMTYRHYSRQDNIWKLTSE